MNPYAAKINIDGSCYHNPGGNGGYAGVLEYPEQDGHEIIFSAGYEPTTNNRMEIRAFIDALKYVKSNKQKFISKGITEVEIYTDSENTIRCYRSAETWRSAGWLGQYGNPIRNVDLIKEILTIKSSVGFSFTLNHVRNKSSVITNTVDKLAKTAAKKSFLKLDTGYIRPKVSPTSVAGGTIPFDAQGQEIIIRVFEHSPVSIKKTALYKVKFEVAGNDVIEKYYAHATEDINAQIDRHHFYKSQFNNEPKNPLIESIEEVDEGEVSAQWE